MYNGLAMTSLLNRLTSILEDYKNDLIDKLKDADDEGTGEVSLSVFLDILRDVGAPSLDSEMLDFLIYLIFRQSDSLTQLNYYAFLEIFDEDYLIDNSPHEDGKDFEASSESEDD